MAGAAVAEKINTAPRKRRTTQACNLCRLKKLKCDGDLPQCASCRLRRSKCEFSGGPTKKRGLPVGAYQSLSHHMVLAETLLGSLVERAPSISTTMREILDQYDKGAVGDRSASLDTWRQSEAYASFQGLLSQPRYLKHQMTGHYSFGDSQNNHLYSQQSISSVTVASPEHSFQKRASLYNVAGNDSFHGPNLLLDTNDRLQHAYELLRGYFATYHCSLPVLDKIDALQFVHSQQLGARMDPDEPQRGRNQLMSDLLWSACALALPSNTKRFINKSRVVQSARVRAIDLMVATEQRDSFCVELVQLLLLLASDRLRDAAWFEARDHLSTSYTVSIRHGLFDVGEQRTWQSYVRSKRRRRLWAAFFLLDTLVAANLRIIPLIRWHDRPMPTISEDEWEEWDEWSFQGPEEIIRQSPARIASTFNQTIQLSYLFNKYLSSIAFYYPKEGDSSKTRVDTLLSSHQVLKEDLASWVKNLPDYLRNAFPWDEDGSAPEAHREVPSYVLELAIAYNSFLSFAYRQVASLIETLSSMEESLARDCTASRYAAQQARSRVAYLSNRHAALYGGQTNHPTLNAMLHLIALPETCTRGVQPNQQSLSKRSPPGHVLTTSSLEVPGLTPDPTSGPMPNVLQDVSPANCATFLGQNHTTHCDEPLSSESWSPMMGFAVAPNGMEQPKLTDVLGDWGLCLQEDAVG